MFRRNHSAPAERMVRDPRSGLSLVEVMVSILLLAMLGGAVGRSLIMARQITAASSQRVSAYGLCEARLEQSRGSDYSDVVATNFPTENGLTLSHLSGETQQALLCNRSVTIQDLYYPDRKEVVVNVDWTYRGQALQETATGVLYPR